MTFPGHFVSKICWEAEDPMYIALELTVIPVELRVAKDEEDENLQATAETGESAPLILSTNVYLMKRAEKSVKAREKQKYLKTFEGGESPSLKELQQLTTEVENPRYKARVQKPPVSTPPPWEIHQRAASGLRRASLSTEPDGDSYDLEKEASTLRHRKIHGGEGDVDEGFIESPSSPIRKSKPVYKKPMPQSKRRFRAAASEEETEGGPTPTKPASGVPGKPGNPKTGPDRAAPSNRASVSQFPNQKKHLDLAGFTRRSEGADEEKAKTEEIPANQILTLFVCSTAGILKHEKILKPEPEDIFLGLDVPYWYALSKTKGSGDESKASVRSNPNPSEPSQPINQSCPFILNSEFFLTFGV